MKIDSFTVLPLYSQIKEALKAKILDGSYTAYQKLPSESEMMEAFGVSRITVRHAVNDLQKEGLLFKIHGKGTFVASPKVSQQLTHLQGFGEAMKHAGHESHSRVLHLGFTSAPAVVRAKLRLDEGAQLIKIRRVRYVDREPVSVDVSYLDPKIGSKLSKSALRDHDLFFLLENQLGHPLDSADVEIYAVAATVDIADQLRLDQGSPILRIERLTYAKQEMPILFEYLHYAADRFRYNLKITRRLSDLTS